MNPSRILALSSGERKRNKNEITAIFDGESSKILTLLEILIQNLPGISVFLILAKCVFDFFFNFQLS